MSKDLTEPTKHEKESSKPDKIPFFSLADDELFITHGNEPKPHRIVFRNSEVSGAIPVSSSIFMKLDNIIKISEKNSPWSFFKNECYSLGLTKHGNVIIHVKSDLKLFPKEFLRSLKADFLFDSNEIRAFIERLDFVDLEISHKINDPLGKLKNSKIEFDIEGLVNKLIVFTDESFGSLELEIKGDPETSGNLEFLLRDKLNAILYFAELTKIIAKLMKIQNELNNSINFVRNGLTFLIDDLLNKRFIFTEQNKNGSEK